MKKGIWKTKPSSLLRSKNAYLADLPPGSSEGTRGKSVGKSVGRGQSPRPSTCSVELESDYKTLENDFLEYREKYQLEDDVPEQVASLLWKVSLLEKELEGKNEMIDLLKKIIFKAM